MYYSYQPHLFGKSPSERADPLDDKIQEHIFPAYLEADSQDMACFQDLYGSADMMQDDT
jgi:hypothetical protein